MMPQISRNIVSPFLIALLSCGFLRGAEPAKKDMSPKNPTLVYVGTYTDSPSKSKGIYLFWLRTENNDVSQNITLVPLGLAAEVQSPSYLELDQKRRLLFCVNETSTFNGKPGGGVSAFSIGPGTGKLKLINQQSSMGAGPCHLVLDKGGKNLLVANYD